MAERSPRRLSVEGQLGVGIAGLLVVWLVGLFAFRRWIAHNDFAIFRIELEHLLRGDVDLVGAYSRLGVAHPGPLREWLFVLPYWVSGRRAAALPATSLALNVAWMLVGVTMVWRHRHRLTGAAIAVGLMLTVLALRDQLASPWNPHLAVLPLYIGCCAAVLALRGGRSAALVAVIAASFAAQLHASALVVGGLLIVVGCVARLRSGEGWQRFDACGVAVALWIGPLVDLSKGADSNIVLMMSAGEASARIGWGRALAHVSRLLLPTTMLRSTAINPTTAVFDGWSRLLVVACVVACVGACAATRLGRDRRRWGEAGVVLGVLGAAWVSVAAFVEPPYRYIYGPLQAAMVFVAIATVAAVAKAIASFPAVSRTATGWWRGAQALAPSVGVVMPTVMLTVMLTVGLVVVAMTPTIDPEGRARTPMAVERSVVEFLVDRPDWATVNLVDADVAGANVSAEIADAMLRMDADPRSWERELELPAPDALTPAFVTAMGEARACLLRAGAESVTEGIAASVGRPVTVFAIADPASPGAGCVDL